MVHVVTYDLHNPGRDYAAVKKLLESASGGSTHPQGSVWFIDTLKDTAWWRDQLKQTGDANDEYFVAQMQKHWASSNMDKASADWLKADSRRW